MDYGWTAWLYLLTLVPTAFASWFASGAAIDFVNRLPGTRYGPVWMVWAVNLVPAFLAGFVIYFTVTGVSIVRRHGDIAPHRVRARALYVACGLLMAYIVWGSRSPDWGLFGQLFVWPCAAFAGDIVAQVSFGSGARGR